jgi:hypothetical protein
MLCRCSWTSDPRHAGLRSSLRTCSNWPVKLGRPRTDCQPYRRKPKGSQISRDCRSGIRPGDEMRISGFTPLNPTARFTISIMICTDPYAIFDSNRVGFAKFEGCVREVFADHQLVSVIIISGCGVTAPRSAIRTSGWRDGRRRCDRVPTP